MPISLETASTLVDDLVRVMKLFGSMRGLLPRLHPGAEPAAYPILFNLAREPRRVSGLADCVHSDISTVSRQVTALVGHGLAEKVPDPLDGRASMVQLTVEGTALVERLRSGRGEWFREMLHDWEPDEAQAFIGHLERFSVCVEAARERLRQGATEMTEPPTDTTTTKEHS